MLSFSRIWHGNHGVFVSTCWVAYFQKHIMSKRWDCPMLWVKLSSPYSICAVVAHLFLCWKWSVWGAWLFSSPSRSEIKLVLNSSKYSVTKLLKISPWKDITDDRGAIIMLPCWLCDEVHDQSPMALVIMSMLCFRVASVRFWQSFRSSNLSPFLSFFLTKWQLKLFWNRLVCSKISTVYS